MAIATYTPIRIKALASYLKARRRVTTIRTEQHEGMLYVSDGYLLLRQAFPLDDLAAWFPRTPCACFTQGGKTPAEQSEHTPFLATGWQTFMDKFVDGAPVERLTVTAILVERWPGTLYRKCTSPSSAGVTWIDKAICDLFAATADDLEDYTFEQQGGARGMIRVAGKAGWVALVMPARDIVER